MVVAVEPYNEGSTLITTGKRLSEKFSAKVDVIEILCNPFNRRFDEPKKREIHGLINRGAFKIVPKKGLPSHANILKGRISSQ